MLGRYCIVLLSAAVLVTFGFRWAGAPSVSSRESGASKETARRHATEAAGQGAGNLSKQAGISADEVKEILGAEFDGMFAAEESLKPWFLVGDLNGDGADDIVVSVKLAARLSETDTRVPPFNLSKAALIVSGEGEPVGQMKVKHLSRHEYKVGDLARYRDERLVAVIHGTKGGGLRGVESAQKYVLLDAVELGSKQMRLYSGKLPEASDSGDLVLGPPPKLIGQAVIFSFKGIGTALYWGGNHYGIYPVDGPLN